MNVFKEILNTYVNNDNQNLVQKVVGHTKLVKDKDTVNAQVYLVFPALENSVTERLQEVEHKRTVTINFNSYKKVENDQLEDSQTLEDSIWKTIKNFDNLFEAFVFTDDTYIEEVLNEHNVKYTLVYPESANREDYLALLTDRGYKKSLVETFKNNWSSFIKAVPTKNTKGAFSTYVK